MRQQVFTGDPAPLEGTANERRAQLENNLVDALATGHMRALWVCVNRDGASLPAVEQARKQTELTPLELSAQWRAYLARTTDQVRASTGAAHLTDWYGTPDTCPGQPLTQPALFGMEATQ